MAVEASILNLNDSTPAAPSGNQNVHWQKGSSTGNDPKTGYPIYPVSAYIPVGGGLTEVRETPSGALNGANVTFTLSYTPSPTASLFLQLNGVEQILSTDYTLSTSTLTFSVAPKSSDYLVAQYTH